MKLLGAGLTSEDTDVCGLRPSASIVILSRGVRATWALSPVLKHREDALVAGRTIPTEIHGCSVCLSATVPVVGAGSHLNGDLVVSIVIESRCGWDLRPGELVRVARLLTSSGRQLFVRTLLLSEVVTAALFTSFTFSTGFICNG